MTVATTESPGPGLDVVLGRADEMRAEVIVVLSAAGDHPADATLSGTLVGPVRGRDITLPVTARLARMPPAAAGAPAGRFLVTEPAYWTPALPNLYRLELSVGGAGGTAVKVSRTLGLRRLGIRGRSLWLEGRRYVPRGVASAASHGDTPDFDPGRLRHAAAAAVIEDPSTAVAAAADAAGVAIVARLPASASVETIRARLHAWKSHPSIVVAVLPPGRATADPPALAATLAREPGAILVAAEVDGSAAAPADLRLGGCLDSLVVDLPADGLPHDSWRGWPGPLPLIARRRIVPGEIAGDRGECDRLQADLAAWGVAGAGSIPIRDWAGYLVG